MSMKRRGYKGVRVGGGSSQQSTTVSILFVGCQSSTGCTSTSAISSVCSPVSGLPLLVSPGLWLWLSDTLSIPISSPHGNGTVVVLSHWCAHWSCFFDVSHVFWHRTPAGLTHCQVEDKSCGPSCGWWFKLGSQCMVLSVTSSVHATALHSMTHSMSLLSNQNLIALPTLWVTPSHHTGLYLVDGNFFLGV